jgi:nucleoside-diphosphate-sugar epimerase
MNVIVFGGTGWVGHNIVLDFAGAGYEVTVCSRGQKKLFVNAVSEIKTIRADKNNEADVKKIFAAEKYEIVIDSVPTLETMDYLHKYARGLKHYLHCSSTGGYAPLPFIPCNETAFYNGFAAGWNQKKVYDDKILDLFNREGFPATVIRPCYITGTGMLPLDNLGGRRQDFIKDIINNVELALPNDGRALLQPIHVKDLAHSFLLAAESPNRSIGQVFNICLEKAVTLNRYLEINAAVFNTKPVIKHMPVEAMLEKYAGHIHETGLRFLSEHMCFDISKAKKLLGYAPAHTSEEAIEETAYWAAKENQLI